MRRIISGSAWAEDNNRQERGARHVRRLAALEALARMGGTAHADASRRATAILERFRKIWREGVGQWDALERAEREIAHEEHDARGEAQ